MYVKREIESKSSMTNPNKFHINIQILLTHNFIFLSTY